jgi:hypothetical protein
MRLHVEWKLPTIVITFQDGFPPRRMLVEYSHDQNARMGAGRRVATIRPDHFRSGRAVRTLWLERAAGSGFLLLFDAEGDCHAKRLINKGVKRIWLRCLGAAVSKDQVALLEAKECLSSIRRADREFDPYRHMATWHWSVRTVGDALVNGIDAERDCAINLLRHVPPALIERLSTMLRNESVEPSQLGNHNRRLANLLSQRASENPHDYPETNALLGDPRWLAFVDPTRDANPTWDDASIRAALKGKPKITEWRAAVRMAAMRMPVAAAYDLLLEQTYRSELDEQTRSHLAEQLCVLIGRFQWQDVRERTDSLFTDLINRSAFQFAPRSDMLAAFLGCVEKLQVTLRQPSDLQALQRLLYRSAQPIGAWCNAMPESFDAQQVRIAARAASLCKNPQLQGALVNFAKRTADAPSAQGAVFRALGAIRAEETDSSEPIAQLLSGALRQADAEGRHAAALDALEQYVPYENSRTLLELVRDALESRLPVSAEHTPRIVGLIAKHGLFDLNDIATDALVKCCLEHPEWRDAIMETWRAVPDPHFVRSRLLSVLHKDANLREQLERAVPTDNDFAPLRDALQHLRDLADLEQLEKALLERLRRLGSLVNDVVGGGVRLPERIADVNGFLSDLSAYMQMLNVQYNALNRQISALIEQGGLRLPQQHALRETQGTLQAACAVIREQLDFIRNGISVSDRAAGALRNQLSGLRNSPNLDSQVARQLQGIEDTLSQLQSGQADLSQQRQALESALRQTEDQLRHVTQALQSYSQADPNTPAINRLTEERQRISEAISQLQPDDINNAVHTINERRRELQERRDRAIAEWNNAERMAERRARLQARLAEKRRERLNQLRAYRKSLEGV